MKQIKVMAAVAAAGLMLLGSCSKENTNGVDNNDGTRSVTLGVVYEAETRASGAPVLAGSLTPSAGHIFFADATGRIDTHVGVGNSAGGQQITLAELTTKEAVIDGIASSATFCYIVMNDAAAQIGTASGITTNYEGQNISAVTGQVIPVGNINDATGSVANAPLYGTGTVVPSAAGSTTVGGKPYEAEVSVNMNSLISRIQVGKISAKPYTYTDAASASQTVTIDEFTLEGIYINNFYHTMTVGSALSASTTDSAGDPDQYSTTAGSTPYIAGGVGRMLADYIDTATTNTPASLTPATAGNVWAYNVFPATDFPHVIIKISEVKYTDTANNTQITTSVDQFLTISKFKYASTHPTKPGQDVAGFEANNIYTFGDIQFDINDLTTAPYVKTTSTYVEIVMMSWVDNPIEWDN